MGEGLGGERGSAGAGEATRSRDLVEDRSVAVRTHHDPDRLEVLRPGTDHRRAADIDLLDQVVEYRAARDGLPEGVQVHDDEVEGIDPALSELRYVLLVATIGQ